MRKGLWGILKPLGKEESVKTQSQAFQFAQQDEKALELIITSLGDDFFVLYRCFQHCWNCMRNTRDII